MNWQESASTTDQQMQQYQQQRQEEQLHNHQNAPQIVNKQDQQVLSRIRTPLREDIKSRLAEKCRVTLHTNNFDQWRTAIRQSQRDKQIEQILER